MAARIFSSKVHLLSNQRRMILPTIHFWIEWDNVQFQFNYKLLDKE